MQELYDDDFQRHPQFCNWARDKMQDDTFFNNVLFTNEVTLELLIGTNSESRC